MQILHIYRRLIRYLGLIEISIAVSFLAAVITLIFTQVVVRYIFNEPQAWIEELCTYLFIWIVFLGAAVAMKLDRHIRVSSFEGVIGLKTKLFLRILSLVVTLVALTLVVIHAQKFVTVEMRSTSIALPINIPRAFFFSIPLIWGCISISIAAIYIFICDVLYLLSNKKIPPALLAST